MAWEYRHGKTRQYYYKSRKVNGKVVKEYYGCGHTAKLFAAMDAERKWQREQDRIERERLASIDQQVDEFVSLVNSIAVGFMVTQGFYRHKGNHSDWRKRRNFMGFKDLRILEEAKMTLNTKKIDMEHVHENLQQLVQQGETGDTNAVLALQPVIQGLAIYEHVNGMGKEVKSRLTHYMAGGDPAIQENLLTEMALSTTVFLETVSASSPFEQHLFSLLAEEMEICRLQTRHADTVDARHNPQEPQQKRQDRAHKRYQNAIRTTAQVYKALKGKAKIQLNIAENQIVA